MELRCTDIQTRDQETKTVNFSHDTSIFLGDINCLPDLNLFQNYVTRLPAEA